MPKLPTPASPDRPGPGARRRSGPAPGHTESRRTILDCARVAFGANGYAGTSLRGVAREAQVDPSLIVHFFGSKAGLFGAAVESTFESIQLAAQVIDVAPAEIGRFVSGAFLANWDQDERRFPIVSLISAALADDGAAQILREFMTTQVTLPVMTHLGTDQPELRAALLSSQLLGLGLARYALAFDALAEAPTEQLMAWLAETVQRTCTAPLPPGRAWR
jgi:AcrR family transcriptional regulator